VGKKVLLLVGAFVTPGGLLALALAWIATRPDVQLRIEELFTRAIRRFKSGEREAQTTGPIVLHELQVISTPPVVRVPVSQSRCHRTVLFPAVRAA